MQNIFMKKLLLLSSLVIAGFLAMGTGCNRLPITESNTDDPARKVTHIVMHEANQDDLDNGSTSGDAFDVYLADSGSRAEIYETIQVDNLPADATTMYFFSDLTTGIEYMFVYPNALTEADRAALPEDHPLKQGKNIITSLPINKRPSGNPDQSLIELMLEPILTFPKDKLRADALEPYLITDTYEAYAFASIDEPAVKRHTTIDPKTNLPTQVQLLDKDTGDSIETFVIDKYVIEDQNAVAEHFFTLDVWKESLPGNDYVIVEDDLQ